MTYTILGRTFELRPMGECDGGQNTGFTDVPNNIIYFRGGMILAEQRATILEELVHAVDRIFDLELTHRQIIDLSIGLGTIPELRIDLPKGGRA